MRKTAAAITLEDLVDAGEAMLLEMVKLTRAAAREDSSAMGGAQRYPSI